MTSRLSHFSISGRPSNSDRPDFQMDIHDFGALGFVGVARHAIGCLVSSASFAKTVPRSLKILPYRFRYSK